MQTKQENNIMKNKKTENKVMETIKAICKIEGKTPILFFPDATANNGMIASFIWVGQHSEASIDYYSLKCRNPRNDAERSECANLVMDYEKHFDCKIERVKRQSAKMRAMAMAWSR